MCWKGKSLYRAHYKRWPHGGPFSNKCIDESSTVSSLWNLTDRPPKRSLARFVKYFFFVGPHWFLISLQSFHMSLSLLCWTFSEQAHLPLMFLCCSFPCLIDFLLYNLLTVGLVIVILPCLFSRYRIHIWPLKLSPALTSSPRAIFTAQSQILLWISPLSHNSTNFICTKLWSSSSILSVPFGNCSWTCPFNHSWWLIRKPSSSRLCKISQQYFHCELTIYSIPTTTPAAQTSSVLQEYFFAVFYYWILRHALAILYCDDSAPMDFSGRISSSWNLTCPFPFSSFKIECQMFGCIHRLARLLENCRTSSSNNSSLSLSEQCKGLRISSYNLNVIQQGHRAYVVSPHLCSILFIPQIFTKIIGYPNIELFGTVVHHFIHSLPIHQDGGCSFHHTLLS